MLHFAVQPCTQMLSSSSRISCLLPLSVSASALLSTQHALDRSTQPSAHATQQLRASLLVPLQPAAHFVILSSQNRNQPPLATIQKQHRRSPHIPSRMDNIAWTSVKLMHQKYNEEMKVCLNSRLNRKQSEAEYQPTHITKQQKNKTNMQSTGFLSYMHDDSLIRLRKHDTNT